MFSKIRVSAALAVAALPLTLIACGGSSESAPEMTRISPASPTSQSTEEHASTISATTETITSSTTAETDKPTGERDPADFASPVSTGGFYVESADAYTHCRVVDTPTHMEDVSYCDFNSPSLPMLSTGSIDMRANTLGDDPALGMYPTIDMTRDPFGEMKSYPQNQLQPGERVTIGDTTFTQTDASTFEISRGGSVATMTDGVLTTDMEKADGVATSGQKCGEVETYNRPANVVVSKDGTDCAVAQQVMTDYFAPGAKTEGSAGIFMSEQGWECSRGPVLSGWEEIGANQLGQCTDRRSGTGTVVAVPSAW